MLGPTPPTQPPPNADTCREIGHLGSRNTKSLPPNTERLHYRDKNQIMHTNSGPLHLGCGGIATLSSIMGSSLEFKGEDNLKRRWRMSAPTGPLARLPSPLPLTTNSMAIYVLDWQRSVCGNTKACNDEACE